MQKSFERKESVCVITIHLVPKGHKSWEVIMESMKHKYRPTKTVPETRAHELYFWGRHNSDDHKTIHNGQVALEQTTYNKCNYKII